MTERNWHHLNFLANFDEHDMAEIEQNRKKLTLNPRLITANCHHGDDQDYLLCPLCSSEYLHHHSVAVFDRVENDPTTKLTTVLSGFVSSTNIPSDPTNPSNRRDGVAISFWCENCHAISELTIAQNKGTTFIGWRPATVFN
jgi:hypothetical protein